MPTPAQETTLMLTSKDLPELRRITLLLLEDNGTELALTLLKMLSSNISQRLEGKRIALCFNPKGPDHKDEFPQETISEISGTISRNRTPIQAIYTVLETFMSSFKEGKGHKSSAYFNGTAPVWIEILSS